MMLIYTSLSLCHGGRKKGESGMDYMTARSRVDRDSVLLKSPLRLKPGAWVELRTCVVF